MDSALSGFVHFQFRDMMFISSLFQVDVQMMYKEQRFNVYRDLEINASVLHLPFNSSQAMLLMLPDDMNTLENAIAPERVTKWLKRMEARLEPGRFESVKDSLLAFSD